MTVNGADMENSLCQACTVDPPLYSHWIPLAEHYMAKHPDSPWFWRASRALEAHERDRRMSDYQAQIALYAKAMPSPPVTGQVIFNLLSEPDPEGRNVIEVVTIDHDDMVRLDGYWNLEKIAEGLRKHLEARK